MGYYIAAQRHRTAMKFILLGFAILYVADAQDTTALYSTDQHGEGTYYQFGGTGGNCGIDVLPPWTSNITYLSAINNDQYISGDESAGCGICVEGTWDGSGSGANPPASPFTAYIVDRCPECAPGDIDFGTGLDGRWGISWRAVPCPVGSSNMQYEFEGSNEWYLKLGIRNHRCGVSTVEVISQPGEPWRQASRTQDNFFVCNGDCGPTPFSLPIRVRVTSTFGDVIEDEIPQIVTTNNMPIEGSIGAQFQSCGSSNTINPPGETNPPVETETETTSTDAPIRQTSLPLTGVSLSVAEFGAENLPGVFNTDYRYPTEEEVDYFVSKGMNMMRICFQWERIQRSENAAFDEAEIARLVSIVKYTTNHAGPPADPSQPVYALLDPHNYARYYGGIVGDTVPVSVFADFWTRMSEVFKDDQRVIFGLMNEPYGMPTELWLSDANAAIAAIRDTGATNLIAVPGMQYTGAFAWHESWYGTPNSEVMSGVIDPLDNFVFELHQYLDGDSSGTTESCVSENVGVERMARVTEWMREHGYQTILAEFGGGTNELCYTAMRNLLDFLEQNSDVYIGWAYWAAGPWWGDYFLSIEPTAQGEDRAQMTNVLLSYLPASGYGSPDMLRPEANAVGMMCEPNIITPCLVLMALRALL